ncbi:MAG: HAMP domain-containing histidine kinase [Victivallales bacterium]|nr:HAMP domain-containing histidine kinase [Victivallales bacterium]
MNSWRGTLKFRLTKYYVGVFAVLWLGSALLVYHSQRGFQWKGAENTLFNLVNECQFEYICQTESPVDSSAWNLKELPKACLDKIKEDIPNFIPYSAYCVEDMKRFILAGASNGKPIMAVFDNADKRIVSIDFCVDHGNMEYLHKEFNEEPYGQWENSILLMVASQDGNVLAKSAFNSRFIPSLLSALGNNVAMNTFQNIHLDDTTLLVTTSELYDGNLLIVAQNMGRIESNLRHLMAIFGFSMILFVSIGIALTILLAQKVSSGLTKIGQAASEIAQGNYEKRVEYKGEGKEIDSLIHAFNHMVDNTEKMLKGLENVTDDIAHDLKTPLTRMQAQAELEMANQSNVDFAASIAENCDEMLSIINTMLEISRIEKHMGHVIRSSINFSALLNKLHEAFMTLAEDQNVRFNVVMPQQDIFIEGNERQLEQMTANLIDNAIKYTHDGGSVTILLKQQQDNSVCLVISDTGVGIAPDDIPKIFDRFFRADTSRSTSGNGLGLSMVKAVVESMGGSISVESERNKGTQFTVILPTAGMDSQ